MKLLLGDSQSILQGLQDNCVDAVVTDPPYELGFMGKAWDNTGIAYNVDLWKEVLRVLKPGGHLLSFGGSRTYHRMACAIEDAGFEIRDQIMWVYGSGFPKSLNIGKAVDKLQGNEREVVGDWKPTGTARPNRGGSHSCAKTTADCGYDPDTEIRIPITKGTSAWEGWGTALKPAHEPIVLARKPLSEKTVAENVLKWGVGGLAIDNCRIGCDKRFIAPAGNTGNEPVPIMKSNDTYKGQWVNGRFPANFIHDGSDEVTEMFPNTKAGVAVRHNSCGNTFGGDNPKPPMDDIGYADSGSASRFFYCAKASKSERDRGCDGLDKKEQSGSYQFGIDSSLDGNSTAPRRNHHPTVKPIALMKYLIKLVSREGQTILDPFMGSGTTGVAAKELGRRFIGIDKQPEYLDIAIKRIGL